MLKPKSLSRQNRFELASESVNGLISSKCWLKADCSKRAEQPQRTSGHRVYINLHPHISRTPLFIFGITRRKMNRYWHFWFTDSG